MTEKALTKPPVSQEQWLSEQTDVEFFKTPDGALALSFGPDFARRFNCLVPISQVLQLDRSWRPVPKVIKLVKGVDAYKKSGKWQLNKQGLGKLAALSQVEKDGDPTTDFMGGQGVSIAVRARQRNIDGTWRRTSATKTVWFKRAEAKVRREAVDDNGQPLSDAAVEHRLDEFYEHVTSKTETKAWLRCVRELLGIPNAFTDAELDKPFFVMGVAFVPDWSNPHIAHMLDLQFGQGVRELYGDPPAEAAPPVLREVPAATGDYDADLGDEEWDDDDGEHVAPVSHDGDATATQADLGEARDAPSEPASDLAEAIEPAEADPTAVEPGDPATGDDHTEQFHLPMPDQPFTPMRGPFADRPVDTWIGTVEGQQWLAFAIARMPDNPKRANALEWLSWGVGSEVSIEDLQDAHK